MLTGSDLELLRRTHADQLGHSGGSLLDHLAGTAALLESWGAPAALCRAGLFHSIYGTEAFSVAFREAAPASTERQHLRAQLGAEAEELVYLFGIATRDSLHRNLDGPAAAPAAGPSVTPSVIDRHSGAVIALAPATFAALLQLSAANWIEQQPRLCPELGRARAAEYRRMLPLLPLPARAALRRALARVIDADPTADPVPLHQLLAFRDPGLVDRSCGALDVRYLGALSARLVQRIPPALSARLDALGDAAFLALLRAPATCGPLLAGGTGDAELEAYLEGALQIEEWRAGARRRIERDAWSAGGELYLPAGTEATAHAGPAELLAELAAAPRPFDPARPYLAPILAGWIIADLHSPEATRALGQLAYKHVPYGPAEPFTAEERDLVLAKLARALAGLARIRPVTTRFLRYTLATIIPRKQTQPHLYPSSFKGSSTEAAIHRVNIYNLQLANVDAARLAQSILHETVHNHLYKRELFQPTVIDAGAAALVRVTSPWSGNLLDLYVFAHSSAVHYALHGFFSEALRRQAQGQGAPELPPGTCAWFRDRAVKGFSSPSWTAILEEHRELLAPAMARDLIAMRDAVLASAEAVAVEAA